MGIIEAILLGLVQGLTEFIPISSSGHLILMQHWLGVTEAGLTFDVALHIGTLLALFAYFFQDMKELAIGVVSKNQNARLAWLIAVATVPAVVAGYFLEDAADSTFRSVGLVSVNLIAMGVVMLVTEWLARSRKNDTQLKDIGAKQGLLVGVAQTLALVPGISRSGSTITAGLISGLDRVAAARFSFLLAVPVTAGAIVKVVVGEGGLSRVQNELGVFGVGITTAFLSGMVAINFLLRFLSKRSLATFAYYRIGLGLLVLAILAT